jgi:hypothetical protein
MLQNFATMRKWYRCALKYTLCTLSKYRIFMMDKLPQLPSQLHTFDAEARIYMNTARIPGACCQAQLSHQLLAVELVECHVQVVELVVVAAEEQEVSHFHNHQARHQ